MYTSGEFLKDGFSEYEIAHVGTHPHGEADMYQMVSANGYLETIAMVLPLARELVAQAEDHCIPFEVTVHQSPQTYGFEPRQKRFAQVVQHETHGELPVILEGHSWGLPQSVETAESIRKTDQQVQAVMGIAPNGLTPVKLSREMVKSLVVGGWHESRVQAELLKREGLTSENIGAVLMRHIVKNPLLAGAEGFDILTKDYTKRVVELSQEVPVTLAGCESDAVCPHDIMKHNLTQAGFDVDRRFISLKTSHGGPLFQPRQHAGVLFPALLKDLQS
jgi:hypothetical protein